MSTPGQHDPYGPYGSRSEPADPYEVHDPYAAQDSFASSSSFASPYSGPGPTAAGPSPWMQPARQSSGMALAGFVVSLVSMVMCTIASPVALVLSVLGMRETGPSASVPQEGRGFAIAGLVLSILGCLGLLAAIAYIILMIVISVAAS